MSALYFVTPGLIDLDAVFTFGVHAKENENPIGYFGTGLKFAVATLLRTSHEILIHRGDEIHRIHSVEMEFRGKKFQKVFLGERDLGFTTELGKNWEVWMAYRELESNTRDEKGYTAPDAIDVKDRIASRDDTIIEVRGSGIRNAYNDRHTIFCATKVLAASNQIEVREGESQYIFYRGVRVYSLPLKSRFTYNIVDQAKLSEDRHLIDAPVPWQIGRRLASLKDVETLKAILTTPKGIWEGGLDYCPAFQAPSEEFFQAFEAVALTANVNRSAGELVRGHGRGREVEVPIDALQARMVEKACDFLLNLGYPIKDFPIKYVELIGAWGEARNGTIYISPACFRKGTKFLAATLLEEYLHLKEGVYDETRRMQDLLFDIIITMGEKVSGEPI